MTKPFGKIKLREIDGTHMASDCSRGGVLLESFVSNDTERCSNSDALQIFVLTLIQYSGTRKMCRPIFIFNFFCVTCIY